MNITLDEIKSKAPEGATHWLIAVTKNPVYFDVNNELIFTKKVGVHFILMIVL